MKEKQPRMRAQIPTSIYLNNQALQTDRLTQLPGELGRMVRDHLPDDADKTCLALTCKANAHFFEDVKNDVRQKGTRQQPHTLIKKLKLMILLRGFRGTRNTRLCFNCAKFMPIAGAWGGKTMLENVVDGKVYALHTTQGPRCPACIKHDQSVRAKILELNKTIASNALTNTRTASLKASVRRHRQRCR